jgi:acyl-CoA synthetase (NDP forming)
VITAGLDVQAGAGLVMQSGGLGFALVDQLSRLGIGISSFASVGNKLDVSSNDMLLWWEHDGVTRLAILYIESFGNPRKFARTARRVAHQMPVLTVHAGRSAAGQQAAAPHTAAFATPLASRQAPFVPDGGAVTGPVDTTATVSCDAFRQCLELLSAAADVDAIIALVLPTAATGDLTAAITQAHVSVPIAAVMLSQPESVRLLDDADGKARYPHFPTSRRPGRGRWCAASSPTPPAAAGCPLGRPPRCSSATG